MWLSRLGLTSLAAGRAARRRRSGHRGRASGRRVRAYRTESGGWRGPSRAGRRRWRWHGRRGVGSEGRDVKKAVLEGDLLAAASALRSARAVGTEGSSSPTVVVSSSRPCINSRWTVRSATHLGGLVRVLEDRQRREAANGPAAVGPLAVDGGRVDGVGPCPRRRTAVFEETLRRDLRCPCGLDVEIETGSLRTRGSGPRA